MKKLLTIITLFFLSGFIACEEVLEKPLENKQIKLLAPKDSLVNSSSEVNFYWEELEGASSYKLQIVTPSFDSIERLILDTNIHANVFKQQLDSGTYQWRVKGLNSSSETAISKAWKLTIQP